MMYSILLIIMYLLFNMNKLLLFLMCVVFISLNIETTNCNQTVLFNANLTHHFDDLNDEKWMTVIRKNNNTDVVFYVRIKLMDPIKNSYGEDTAQALRMSSKIFQELYLCWTSLRNYCRVKVTDEIYYIYERNVNCASPFYMVLRREENHLTELREMYKHYRGIYLDAKQYLALLSYSNEVLQAAGL